MFDVPVGGGARTAVSQRRQRSMHCQPAQQGPCPPGQLFHIVPDRSGRVLKAPHDDTAALPELID